MSTLDIQSLASGSTSGPRGTHTVGIGKSSGGGSFFEQLMASMKNNMLTIDQGGVNQVNKDQVNKVSKNQTFQVEKQGAAPEGQSLRSPVERLRTAMEAGGQPLEKLSLPAEQRDLLENALCSSGYSQEDAEDIIRRATQSDGSINMGSFFGLLVEYPADQGVRFGLKQEDRPALVQLFLEMGVPQDSIDSFLQGLEQHGENYLVSGLPQLLEQARGREGQPPMVDRRVLGDLLSRLGLNEREITQVLNSETGTQNEVKAELVMKALELAARKQEQGLSSTLKELTLKVRVAPEGNEQAGQADRIRAEMIKALTQIEAQVEEQGKNFRETLEQSLSYAEDSSLDASVMENPEMLAAALQDKEVAKHISEVSQGRRLAAELAEMMDENSDRSQAETGSKSNQNGQKETGQRAHQESWAQDQNKTGLEHSSRLGASHGQEGGVDFGYRLSQAAGGRTASGGTYLLPAQVTRQVGQELARMVNQNIQTLRLELKPPTLGEVHMELVMRDGAVKASLMAETVGSKQALEAGLEQLKQQLTAQGIKVDSIEISVNPDAQERADLEQNKADYERSRRQAAQKDSTETEDGDNSLNLSQPQTVGAGRLSIFA